MTEFQWKSLCAIVDGKTVNPLPTGFIVDSPWLPKWFGVKILDYFTNDDILSREIHNPAKLYPTLLLSGIKKKHPANNQYCTSSQHRCQSFLPVSEIPPTDFSDSGKRGRVAGKGLYFQGSPALLILLANSIW